MPSEIAAPQGLAQRIVNEGPIVKSDFRADFLKTESLKPPIDRNSPFEPDKMAKSYARRLNLGIGKFVPERLKRKKKDKIENEFSNKSDPELIPLPLDSSYPPEFQAVLPGQLTDVFNYYSRTRDVEFDSPNHPSEKARFIQTEIVDKMTEGTGVKTRVVIMNKGSDSEAFVVPDGTIFISQSLINNLNTLDEVAGVLAHEIGHLINKSSLKIHQSRDYFGQATVTGWVQENACDIQAPNLLQDAGFNSMGFGRAIEKISGTNRGAVHMSGLFRGVISAGRHFVKHSTTSTVKTREIPNLLKGEVKKTNLEIVRQLVGEHYPQLGTSIEGHSSYKKRLKQALENLHPKDFKTLYNSTFKESYERQPFEKLKVFEAVMTERLLKSGYSSDEAKVFLLITKRREYGSHHPEDVYQFSKVEDLEKSLDALEKFENDPEMAQKMYRLVFMTGSEINDFVPLGEEPPRLVFLKHLAKYLHDPDLKMDKYGIPVTRESLFSALERIRDMPTNYNYIPTDSSLREGSTVAIENYIKSTFLVLATESKGEIDTDQIKEFLEEAKSRNVPVAHFKLLYGFGVTKDTPKEWIDNYKLIDGVIKEVYGLKDWSPTEENINKFFSEFIADLDNQGESFKTFINNLDGYFKEHKMDDEARSKVVDLVALKIRENNFPSDYGLTKLLRTGEYVLPSESTLQDRELNEQMIKFKMLSNISLSLYGKDGAEFYKHMEEAMGYLGPQLATFGPAACLNLSIDILKTADKGPYGGPVLTLYTAKNLQPQYEVSGNVDIGNFDKLFSLPFITRAREAGAGLSGSSLKELSENIDDFTLLTRKFDGRKLDLFDDSITGLLIGQEARRSFVSILEAKSSQQLTLGDYSEMHQFVKTFYPGGVQKDQIIKRISELVLKSEDPSITLDMRMDYLLDNFEDIGIEGLVIVADRISNINDYRRFKEKFRPKYHEYEEGKGAIKKVYVAELASSAGAHRFDMLIKSARADEQASKEVTTELAQGYYNAVLGFRSDTSIDYDEETKRFEMDAAGRKAFRSLKDVVDTLKGFSQYERFAIALKALTDPGGAFSSDEKRKEFGKSLVEAVGLKKGFLASVVQTVCEKGDRLFIGLPIANMLTPLIFRGWNLENIDYEELGKRHIYSSDSPSGYRLDQIIDQADLPRISNSTTRELTLFGSKYNNGLSEQALGLSDESNEIYQKSTDLLQGLFTIAPESEKTVVETASEIDPSIEAALRAAETNPIGKRGMQIGSQFESFSPAIDRRMANALDSNPGMNKLDFWDELNDEAARATAGGDFGVEAFLQRVTLKGMAGGGSLQTTYFGKYLEDDNSQREIVVKMESPNAAWQVQTGAGIARTVLNQVLKRSIGTVRKNANTTLAIVDFAENWCLRDLNDLNFEQDDDAYRGVIDRFSQLHSGDAVYVPERILTRTRLKSEDRAIGDTINRTFREIDSSVGQQVDDVLENPSIDPAKKKEVVEKLCRLFKFQVRKDNAVETNEGARILVHSDPHLGNFMVDLSGDSPKIGVIDRSMYLRLEEADLPVFEKLMYSDNATDFADAFINRVMDINNLSGVSRAIVASRVWTSVSIERTKQLGSKFDKAALLNSILREFAATSTDVKLDLRLMTRNVAAMQELADQYGIDFKRI